MTEQEVIDLIELWIVANGANEITANVLRPILLEMVMQPNDYIGDITALTTADQSSLVAAINEIVTNIGNIGLDFVKLHQGTNDPNVTPPSSFNVADFYFQVDIDNNPVNLWQYNGVNWILTYATTDLLASHYKGKYNASTNTPTLVNNTGQNGDYWLVTVAGIQDYGNGDVNLKVGDILHYYADDGFWDILANNNQTSDLAAVAFSGNYADLSGTPTINNYFKGKFTSLANLQAAFPTANDGDYAIVDVGSGTDALEYIWDANEGWVKGNETGAATTDALPEGSSNLYWTTARGLGLVLSGLSASSGTFISTDTLLTAFGKIKYLIDNISTTYQVIITALNFGTFSNSLTEKPHPIDADFEIYYDSTDGEMKKISRQDKNISVKQNDFSIYTHATYMQPLRIVEAAGVLLTTIGTADDSGTGPSYAGNSFVRWVRRRYVSSASANSTVSHSTGAYRYIDNTTSGKFFFSTHVGNEDASAVATGRTFFGFYNSSFPNVNPSLMTDFIALANDSSDSNMQIMHNDNSGTATKIDLGSDFPANTVSIDHYLFQAWKFAGSATIYYRVKNIHNSIQLFGSITTNLPASGYYNILIVRNNGTTASAVKLSCSHILASENV